MKHSYIKKTSILLISLLSFNIMTPQIINGLNKSKDIENYILEDDPFDRSFIGSIKQKIGAKIDNLKNKSSQTDRSTIYQEIEIDKISIDGVTLTKEDINNNSQKLKELYLKRNKEEGLKNIKIVTKDKSEHKYSDYLKVKSKNVQPINIASNTTWTKEKGPYYISGEIRVLHGATLTIEAGTDVYFYDTPLNTSKNGILVDGKLIINGLKDNEVNLSPIGENTYSGSWKGIYVTERGSVKASYTNIDKAGAWSDSAIYALGEVNLNNCNITNTLGNGIRAFTDVILRNNNIKNNSGDGINIYRSINDYTTTITSNSISGNTLAGRIVFNDGSSSNYNVINNTTSNNIINGFKLSGTINGDTTFTDIGQNTPYIVVNMDDSYNILENLKIKEKANVVFDKCVVKVENNPSTYKKNSIEVDGKVEFIGDKTKSVTITSIRDNSIYGDTTKLDGNQNPDNTDWSGINVSKTGSIKAIYTHISYTNKAINSLGNTSVSNSNINNTSTGIHTKGDTMSITNSKFSNIERYAFDYNMNESQMDFTLIGNKFENIKSEIGRINLVNSGGSKFTVSSNTTLNNNKNGVVLSGNIGIDTSINNIGTNIPYIVPNLKVNEGTTVDVIAGTILKIEDGTMLGSRSGIQSEGVLNLNGTSTSKVIITSLKDDTVCGDTNGDGESKGTRGDWGSISYKSKNLSNITYADIKYGGDLKDDFMVGGSGALTIKNSNIKHSSQNGVRSTGDGDLRISSSNISYNSKNGIKSSGNTTITSSTISNNDINGVEVDKILNISSSNIQNNNNHGIEASGELDLNSSNINANGKHGLNIRNQNGSNFKLNLVGNIFRDNKEYAAFSKFNHDDDRITGNNNIGINNSINGIGITGEIGANVTLEPAGDEFPFVVPEYVRVKEGKTVTLLDGLTMKFGENAKFDLAGKIDVKGTDSNKVIFTSLKDDSVAGDTNNDGSSSIPSTENEDDSKDYTDWEGIIYENESEGNYENFECKFSYYNMDYNSIPNVKVKDSADSKVSISETKAAYIKQTSNGKEVCIYDYSTNVEKIISSTSNKKKDVIISGNNVAWIEEDRIAVYNISGNSTQYIDSINTENLYLNDGYISWTQGSKLYYKAISSGIIQTIDRSISSSFKPVISSSYIIYKGSDGMIYRTDLKDSKKEYYMLTSTTEHAFVDMYGDNIAFLTKDKGAKANNIIVGDIPTWTAKTVTDNLNVDNTNLSLYKDKVMYFSKNKNKNIIIRNSDNNNELRNESLLTRGYFANDNDIGNKSAIFTSDDKIYILKTKFENSKNEFITGSPSSKSGYDRLINLGNSLSVSLGGKVGADGIVSGGLTLNSGKEGNLSYGVKRNTYGQNTDIGIGREFIYSSGIEGELGIGVGNVASISENLEVGGLKKNSDEYYFKPSQEAYVNMGLLTGSAMLRYNPLGDTITDVISRALDDSLKNILDIKNNSTSYDQKSGLGANWNKSSNASIGASVLSSSIGASLGSNAIAEVGNSKEDGDYLSFTSAYEGNFSINAGLDLPIPSLDEISLGDFTITQDIFQPNILPKLPDIVDIDESFAIEYTIKVDKSGNVEISFKDGEEHSNGYIKEHKYIVKVSNLDNSSPLGKRVNSIYSNINKLDSALSIQQYNVCGDSIFEELKGLGNLLSNGLVEYELVVSKSSENNLGLSFGTEFKEDDESEEKAIPVIPEVGISLQGKKEDVIDVVIDSSVIENGKVTQENLKMAFIPVNDKLIDTELKNIFRGLYNEIKPASINYINSIANYENKAKITSNGLDYAIFMEVPVKDFKNGGCIIDENQSIIQDKSIYLESFNNNGNKVNTYPDGSTLQLKINNWDDRYKNNYSIYEYHAETNSWSKLGGKIDYTNKSISIPLDHNGEYAVGIDKSEPNIVWSCDGVQIGNNTMILEGTKISADIIDSDNINESSIKVKIDSAYITDYEFKNGTVYYIVPGDKNRFTMNIYYEDEYGNSLSKSIILRVQKKSNTIIAEEVS